MYVERMIEKEVRETPYQFVVSPETRLRRFLILGTKNDGYYESAVQLTDQNIDNVLSFAKEAGWNRVVDVTEDVLWNRKAHRVDAGYFVFAIAVSPQYNPDAASRRYAFRSILKCAGTFTHLTLFLSYATQFRGWGNQLVNFVNDWLNKYDVKSLDYQFTKYGLGSNGRNGYTAHDILRLAKPSGATGDRNKLYRYVAGKGSPVGPYSVGYELAKENPSSLVDIISQYELTHEMLPQEAKANAEVWRALIPNMPPMAIIRNLPKLTQLGLLSGWKLYDNDSSELILNKILAGAKQLHPGVFLNAYVFYGKGRNRNMQWNADGEVLNTLQQAFYDSFKYLPNTDLRFKVGVDVSGSMSAQFSDMGVTSAQFAGLVAMTLMRQSAWIDIRGFSNRLVKMNINPGIPIKELNDKMVMWNFGSTDIGLIIQQAINNKENVDCFVVITDGEVNRGDPPLGLLKKYNRVTGRNAKMVSVATSPTWRSVLPDDDETTLNLVGGDPEIPSLVTKFALGEI